MSVLQEQSRQQSPKPEIILICRTSADEGYDGMEYAVLTIDFEAVSSLLQMISVAAMFKTIDSSFHRAAFFKSYVTFHKKWRFDDEVEDEFTEALDRCEEEIDNAEWSVMPHGYKIDEESGRRTDASTVNVDEESVLFAAYDHNGGPTEVESTPLTRETLLDLGKALTEMRVVKAIQKATRRTRVIDLD